MIDPGQIPYLLRLFDDDSETVRRTVLDALAGYGEDLDELLDGLDPPLADKRRSDLHAAIARHLEDSRRARAKFRPGALVRHKRYGYRGVVVDFDTRCKADEDWYRANRTQPDRDQAWYHVLVHASLNVTYAAESSLVEDDTGEAIEHPYIPYFFHGFEDGIYRRNERPWPGHT